MRDILLVARRELKAQTRTKGFVIGLIVSALVVAGIVAVPALLGSDDSYEVGLVGDGSQSLAPAVAGLARQAGLEVDVQLSDDDAAVRTAVEDGEMDAAVVDSRAIVSDGDLPPALESVLQAAHAAVASQQQLIEAGLDPEQVQSALTVPPLEQVTLGSNDDEASQAVAFLTVLVLFFLILGLTSIVAIGVVEEKSSRIVEILLIAVRPWQLLAGKIIAFVMVGLVQLAVFVLAGLSAAAAVGSSGELPPNMPVIIAAALVGFLLGFLFYAATAAALASLVSRQEEVNQVLGPMIMLIMASYFVGIWALNSPNAPAGEALSMIPPFSAMVMPVRVAASEVPAWQVGVALVGMIAAVVVVLYIGGRIYERAVLRTGARLKITEVLRRERVSA